MTDCDTEIFHSIPFFIKNIAVFFHAFLVSLFSTKGVRKKMKKYFIAGQQITKYLPEHKSKKGTPSMGGIAIVAGIIIPTLFWTKTTQILLCAYITITIFMFIGVLDDLKKLSENNNHGISAAFKFFLQICGGTLIVFALTMNAPPHLDPYFIHVPIFSNLSGSLFYLYIPLAVLTITSTANALNVTDGLDGLAVRTVSPCFVLVALLAFIASQDALSHIYSIPYIPF